MSQNHSTIMTGVIVRKAVNANGHLGSLYDACKDRLLLGDSDRIPGRRSELHQPIRCDVLRGNADVSRNILQMIGVEDGLRVSLLLEMAQRMGIVGVLNDSYRVNEHTRLLYYSWVHREEKISDGDSRNRVAKQASTATHVITGITFGIDLILILCPLSEAKLNEIDRILQKITSSLTNGADLVSLITPEEKDLLAKNIQITIHSNIPALTGIGNVSRLLHQIDQTKKNSEQCLPISYSLQPLTGQGLMFRPLPSEMNDDLEQYMLHKRTIQTILKSIAHEDERRLLEVYIAGRLYGAKKQHLRIAMKDNEEKKHLAKLVTEFRSGEIDKLAIDTARSTLKNDTDELIQNLNGLKAKADLVNQLHNRKFFYRNAVDSDVDRNDDERTIERKLLKSDQPVRVLCSNDTLNRDDPGALKKFLADLTQERRDNPHLRLVYADFSYCSYTLPKMMLLSSGQTLRSPRKNPQPAVPLLQTTRSPSTKQPVNDEPINILLLGETGVGKSTFINALANYLTFDSLPQAKCNKPIVMIPVSFLITVGKNFEERPVKFGEMDSSINEQFNTVGQSVTQDCQTYVLDLKQNRRKLQIIDTPGFGDTRGLEQDDQNMEHILQYIGRLSHLNAICFLFKPNSSRLNIFLRTCFTRLFTFLAPAARQNAIFCFTNARSTFYTPGDTAPLLRAMLADPSMNGISFQKENTFCFDSEAFRYLVALRNGITFTEEDEREYQTSWSTSARESNRLIDHIQKHLRPYYLRRK